MGAILNLLSFSAIDVFFDSCATIQYIRNLCGKETDGFEFCDNVVRSHFFEKLIGNGSNRGNYSF